MITVYSLEQPTRNHCIQKTSFSSPTRSILRSRSWPKTPSPCNGQFQPADKPKRTLHPARAHREEATGNGTDHHGHKRPDPLIPLRIPAPPHQETRVGRDVVDHARQHDRGYGIVAQSARRDDLARGLEAQQGDGQALAPVHLLVEEVEAALDDRPLYERGRDQHDGSLHKEAQDQRAPAAVPEHAGRVGEDDAAPDEGDDGHEALRPAVGARGRVGGRGAEAEEDGVARLAGDEGAVGVEEGGVEEPGDEAAEDEGDGGVGERDGGRKGGAEARGVGTGRGGGCGFFFEGG